MASATSAFGRSKNVRKPTNVRSRSSSRLYVGWRSSVRDATASTRIPWALHAS